MFDLLGWHRCSAPGLASSCAIVTCTYPGDPRRTLVCTTEARSPHFTSVALIGRNMHRLRGSHFAALSSPASRKSPPLGRLPCMPSESPRCGSLRIDFNSPSPVCVCLSPLAECITSAIARAIAIAMRRIADRPSDSDSVQCEHSLWRVMLESCIGRLWRLWRLVSSRRSSFLLPLLQVFCPPRFYPSSSRAVARLRCIWTCARLSTSRLSRTTSPLRIVSALRLPARKAPNFLHLGYVCTCTAIAGALQLPLPNIPNVAQAVRARGLAVHLHLQRCRAHRAGRRNVTRWRTLREQLQLCYFAPHARH